MTTNTDTTNCPVAAIAAEINTVISAVQRLRADTGDGKHDIAPSFIATTLTDRLDALQGLAASRQARSSTGAALHALLAYALLQDVDYSARDAAKGGGRPADVSKIEEMVRAMERSLTSCLCWLLEQGADLSSDTLEHYIGADRWLWAALEDAAPRPASCAAGEDPREVAGGAVAAHV